MLSSRLLLGRLRPSPSRTAPVLAAQRWHSHQPEVAKPPVAAIPRSGGDEGATHFGFETIAESEKEEKVHKVFEEVAASYDLMNDAMSAGVHRLWKDTFIERLGPGPGTRLLDMAGGTGDVAFRYINYINGRGAAAAASSSVTISDINQHMLDVGRARAVKLGLCGAEAEAGANNPGVAVEFVCANAERLPFADASYTAYTIAFGIRNCTHIDRVLAEAYRVLQPGGRFMCLEFGHLDSETAQWLYDQYSFTMIPPLGQVLAGQWQPYQYLVESIRKFPRQPEFAGMLERAGFVGVTYENLTMGVVSIHSGFKL